MALATGLAFGAAAASGIALGSSCQSQLQLLKADLKEQKSSPPPPPQAPVPPAPAPAAQRAAVDEEDLRLSTGEGFTMEDARKLADQGHEQMKSKRPAEVLADLQKGNARFYTNRANRPERSAFQRRALISKQFPSVAILGCSDSRVPTELVFDQGLGDLFVIRVAGNCLATSTAASLQYAVHHLKVKVVIVLGHELCGAVKAAQLPDEKLDGEPDELSKALKSIKAGLDPEKLKHIQDSRALDREAVTTNVKKQVECLKMDAGIMSKVEQGDLLISGAFYEISSGIVDFFVEVSA